jgi:hypothetical protein
MLQTMESKSINIISGIRLSEVYKLRPYIKTPEANNTICSRCFYINESANHFCTNCGYPVHNGETLLLYQVRNKQRKEVLHKSTYAVKVARGLLYIIAAFFTVGLGFLFGELENKFFLTTIMLATSALFFFLARWSVVKPFTALLTSFVIVSTFSTIYIFEEFTRTFKTVQGVYTIALTALVSYLLLRGVRGAYKADLINEEMNIV